MKVIQALNVNDAFSKGVDYLLREGIAEQSRNGRVLVAPGPVLTEYKNPKQRVLFSPMRDANPFFHLMESLWMLAGKDDVAFPTQFNSKFDQYSDDGKRFWGAYGYRWREFFGYDQLDSIVMELSRDKNSRRAVLAMWNAANGAEEEPSWIGADDLLVAHKGGKDVPCNTHAYFDARGGRVNMTVCNRSNDAVWGAYGANAVHFSFLQEYIAERLRLPVGVYRQFSNNLHVYTEVYSERKLAELAQDAAETNFYYTNNDLKTIPLGVLGTPNWDRDVRNFVEAGGFASVENKFIQTVAAPMYKAWFLRKDGDHHAAAAALRGMPICDWRLAAEAWVSRRGSVHAREYRA